MTTIKITTLALFSVICLFLPSITKAQEMVTTYNSHPECRWIGGANVNMVCRSTEQRDNSTPNKCNKTGLGICCCAAMVSPHQVAKTSQPNTTVGSDYIPLNFKPQVTMPGISYDKNGLVAVGSFQGGIMSSDLLAKYIKAFYDYGIGIVGILAAIVLMGGGIIWLTSSGNDSKITQAKELIMGSLTGMAILLSSWIILNTINPDLLEMKEIKTKYVDVVIMGCCESSGNAKMIGEKECGNGKFWTNARVNANGTKCEIEGCCAHSSASHHNPGTKFTKCVDTVESDCPFTQTGTTGIRDFIKNQQCYSVPDCSAVTADCSSVKNGDKCANVTGNFYCYNTKCYENDGKNGEPCGTNGGTCTTEAHTRRLVPILPVAGVQLLLGGTVSCDGDKSADSGGRDCGTGLYCCY